MEEAKDIIYFEELEEGTKIYSMGRTITETDLVLFSMLSGDNRPVYCDTNYAQKYSPTGQRIIDPLMIQCLYYSLIYTAEMSAQLAKSILAFLGTTNWKYLTDASIGDTVHSVREIIELRDNKPDRGIMVQKIQLLNQNNEVLQEGISAAYIGKRVFFEKS